MKMAFILKDSHSLSSNDIVGSHLSSVNNLHQVHDLSMDTHNPANYVMHNHDEPLSVVTKPPVDLHSSPKYISL